MPKHDRCSKPASDHSDYTFQETTERGGHDPQRPRSPHRFPSGPGTYPVPSPDRDVFNKPS